MSPIAIASKFETDLAALLDRGPPSAEELNALERQLAGSSEFQDASKTQMDLREPLKDLLLGMAGNAAADFLAQRLHVKPGTIKNAITVGTAVLGEFGRIAFTSEEDLLHEMAAGSELRGDSDDESTDPGDLSTVYSRQARFMAASFAKLAQLVLTLTKEIPVLVTDADYPRFLFTLETKVDTVLAELALNAQKRMASITQTAADKWRDALMEIHLMVQLYVKESPGAHTWHDFKEELLTSLKTLLNFAKIARGSATRRIDADATNTELTAAIARNAVDTSVLCWFRCFRGICCKGDDVVDSTVPVASATDNLIELAMFIDNAVANIRDIASEVKDYQKSRSESELVNLRLRISLRLMNLVKLTIAHKSLENLYQVLNAKTLIILALMQGVQPDSWNSIKKQLGNILLSIVKVLLEARPDTAKLVVSPSSVRASSPVEKKSSWGRTRTAVKSGLLTPQHSVPPKSLEDQHVLAAALNDKPFAFSARSHGQRASPALESGWVIPSTTPLPKIPKMFELVGKAKTATTAVPLDDMVAPSMNMPRPAARLGSQPNITRAQLEMQSRGQSETPSMPNMQNDFQPEMVDQSTMQLVQTEYVEEDQFGINQPLNTLGYNAQKKHFSGDVSDGRMTVRMSQLKGGIVNQPRMVSQSDEYVVYPEIDERVQFDARAGMTSQSDGRVRYVDYPEMISQPNGGMQYSARPQMLNQPNGSVQYIAQPDGDVQYRAPSMRNVPTGSMRNGTSRMFAGTMSRDFSNGNVSDTDADREDEGADYDMMYPNVRRLKKRAGVSKTREYKPLTHKSIDDMERQFEQEAMRLGHTALSLHLARQHEGQEEFAWLRPNTVSDRHHMNYMLHPRRAPESRKKTGLGEIGSSRKAPVTTTTIPLLESDMTALSIPVTTEEPTIIELASERLTTELPTITAAELATEVTEAPSTSELSAAKASTTSVPITDSAPTASQILVGAKHEEAVPKAVKPATVHAEAETTKKPKERKSENKAEVFKVPSEAL